jgi:hypothetical protein
VTTFSASNVAISSASPTLGGSPVTGSVKLKEAQSAYSGSLTAYAAVWMLPNVAGGSTSIGITVTNGAIGNTLTGLLAWEVSGLGTTPLLDASSAQSGASASATSGTTGATTQNAEIILGVLIGLDALTGTPTTPAGYTNLNVLQASSAACGGYQVQSSAGGTYTYANANGGSDPWAGVVVTVYNEAGAHTATGHLTVTPSLSATRAGGRFRTPALSVTPALTATAVDHPVARVFTLPGVAIPGSAVPGVMEPGLPRGPVNTSGPPAVFTLGVPYFRWAAGTPYLS